MLRNKLELDLYFTKFLDPWLFSKMDVERALTPIVLFIVAEGLLVFPALSLQCCVSILKSSLAPHCTILKFGGLFLSNFAKLSLKTHLNIVCIPKL